MDYLGFSHLIFAFLALTFGFSTLRKPKGTRLHRKIGWIYTFSMIGLNITALFIYRLFGGFGPFHWMALISLATVVAAIIPAIRKKPANNWIEMHAQFMCWSYIGLLAATVAEILTRVPGLDFWGAVIFASVGIILFGGIFIRRNSPLSKYSTRS